MPSDQPHGRIPSVETGLAVAHGVVALLFVLLRLWRPKKGT